MPSHGVLYFVARVVGGLLTTVTLAVFTRLLTPVQYGRYALGLTVASIASALLYQWLIVSVGRFHPVYIGRLGVLVAASRRSFRIASTIALAALLLALALPRLAGTALPLMLGVFLAVVALGRYNLLLQIANVQRAPGRYAALTWVKSAVALGCGAALILAGWAELGALYGVVAGLVIAALWQNPLRGVRPIWSEDAKALSPHLLRYGAPLVVTFLGTVSVEYADRLLIGAFLGAKSVGPYAAAYDLSTQTVGAITNVLFLASFPAALAAMERDGEAAARAQMAVLGRSLVGVALPAATGFALLSDDVSELFLGASFRGEVGGFMPLLAAGVWLNGFKSYYLDAIFQLRRETGYQAWNAVLMVMVNIGLNVVLIPEYGVLGAAWATVVAVAAGTLASFVSGRRLMALGPLRADFVKASAACGTMAVPLLALTHMSGAVWLLAKVAIGAGAYLVAAWVLDVGSLRGLLARHLAVAKRSV